MKPHVEEAVLSLRLADRDIKAFEVLSDDADVHLSVVCFHAQQAVEKSLKAALFAHEIEFGRTHDLVKLAHLLRGRGMNYPCKEAKLSMEEIAEIYRNMEARSLGCVFCQACSEEMKPEQARKSVTGLIMCRPCYMLNDTEATEEEIDQALEEDFPGYLASFNQPWVFDSLFSR